MFIPFKDCAETCSTENFVGVIHIGTNGEKYAKAYEKNNFSHALWIEQKQENIANLYKNTRETTVFSKYFCANLSNVTTQNNITFDQLVRENIVDINLDFYDLIVLDLHGEEKSVLEGFGPLLGRFPFKAIYTNVRFKTQQHPNTLEDLDNFLSSVGFERKLTIDNGGPEGESLYVRK